MFQWKQQIHLCAPFSFPYSRLYHNHVLWQIWATMPKKTVSNQRNRSNLFEIQTLCSFHQVRYLDKFLVHARTRHRQHLGLSLPDFQTLLQKIGTENFCLTWSTGNVCKNVSPRPTGLCSSFCWNNSRLFYTSLPPCFPYANSLPPTAPYRLQLPSTYGSLLQLPCPICFFRVRFPTLFAADLKDFLQLISSPISGAANSNKSAPTRFAAGTIFLRKNGIAVLPIACAIAPNPLPLCLPTPLRYGISFCLEATIL